MRCTCTALILLGCLLVPSHGEGARIGDVARVMGMRDNHLVGYGLVIGLDGTGDRPGTEFTEYAMSSLLEEMGITLGPDDLKLRNVAAVLVTADLPPFARAGSRVDVIVSSIGSAKDLRGGVLVQTPLRGADGAIYVVSQGPVSLGGFEVDAPGGNRVKKNHVTVARIPNGGIVEREIPFDVFGGDFLDIVIERPDFQTAAAVAGAINQRFGEGTAIARDPGTVTVPMPNVPSDLGPMLFSAAVAQLDVVPGRPATVVINERTGTIVAGGDVALGPVTIAHGGLTIEITTNPIISQPGAFARRGRTIVAPEAEINVTEKGSLMSIRETTTLADLVQGLNTLGVTPSDVIAIFQALKEAGALDGEIVVI